MEFNGLNISFSIQQISKYRWAGNMYKKLFFNSGSKPMVVILGKDTHQSLAIYDSAA